MRGRLVTAAAAAASAALLIWLALPPAAQVASPPRDDSRVVRGAIHVHTERSDGTGSVPEVAEAARRAGLQFLVLTDHGDASRTPDPPVYRGGILCLDAVEISTTAGHYVALGLLDGAPYRLAGEPRDVVEDVRRLGGFGIAAHPHSAKPELRWTAWDTPVDGIEWLNADSQWRDEPTAAVLRALGTYWFRGPETIAALFDRPDETLTQWDALNRLRPVVGLAGHDAHARIGLRGNWEPANGDVSLHAPSYEAAFRTFGVRVQLREPFGGGASDDAGLLLEGIRAGRVYTAVDALATRGWLTFTASTGERGATAGESLTASGPAVLEARSADVPGLSLVLRRDGRAVASARGPALRADHHPRADVAVYRVEAFLDAAGGRDGVPWIVSNAIRIGTPAALAWPAAAPEATVTATRRIGTEGKWRVEHDPGSRIVLDGGASLSGAPARSLRYALAAGSPRGQYAAAVLAVPRGSLRGWDRLTFRARSDRPMRLSVQVRDPGTGRRWTRSVYVPPEGRHVSVAFAEMTPVEAGGAAVALNRVDSLLFVVDTTNSAPGSTGAVWIGELEVQRVS